jgi:hypothetical protein
MSVTGISKSVQIPINILFTGFHFSKKNHIDLESKLKLKLGLPFCFRDHDILLVPINEGPSGQQLLLVFVPLCSNWYGKLMMPILGMET